jgi:hypothetical protein
MTTSIYQASLYLTSAGCLLEIAGRVIVDRQKRFNPIAASGQTFQNIAAILPITAVLASRIFTAQASRIVKASAGLGIGFLAAVLVSAALTPFALPLFVLIDKDGHLKSPEINVQQEMRVAKYISDTASTLFKIANVASLVSGAALGKLDSSIGFGLAVLSGAAYISTRMTGVN